MAKPSLDEIFGGSQDSNADTPTIPQPTNQKRPSLDEIFSGNESVGQTPSSSTARPSLDDIFSGNQASQESPQQPQPKKGGGIFSRLGSALNKTGKAIGNFGIGVAKGVMSAPTEAAELGADLGLRAAAAVRPDVTYDQLKTAVKGQDGASAQIVSGIKEGVKKTEEQFAPKGTAQEAGFTAEKIAEFFTPAGASAKAGALSKVSGALEKAPNIVKKGAGLLTRAGMEGAEQAARTAIQQGDVEGAGVDLATGAAVPVVGGALKLAGKVASGVAKTMASKLSGVPTAAIEEAFNNPNVIQGAIRKMAQDPDLGPQTIVQGAEDALKALKDARRVGYQQALEAAQTSGAGTRLSLDGVKETAQKAFEKFNVSLKNGKVSFTQKTTLPNSLKNELQEITDRINEWDDLTPTGLDDLREVVDSYYKPVVNPSKADKQFNSMIQDIRKNISDYVGSVSPEIKEMNKKYAQESEFIDALRRELSLGKDKPVTAMRKLMNVFNSKSETYRPLLKQLDEQTGKQLKADIAGLIMSKWTPEGLGAYLSNIGVGLSSLVAPQTLIAAPLASPRIVGETAATFGKAAKSKVLKKAPNAIKPLIKGSAAQVNQ